MILRNGLEFKVPAKGPLSWEELEKKFPEYFANKRGVSFEFSKLLMRKGRDSRGRTIEQWAKHRAISRSGKLQEDGVVNEYRLVDNYTVNDRDRIVPQDDRQIYIGRREELKLNRGKELLWFLWFVSHDIDNNANPMTSPHARVSFTFPAEDAANRLEHRRIAAKVHGFVLDPNKCTKEVLDKIVRVVLSVSADSMTYEEFVDQISGRVASEPDFAKEVLEVIENLSDDLTDIIAMISELKAREVIKVQQGKWKLVQSEGEDETIITTSPKEDNDQRLAKHLVDDVKWRKRLEEIFNG